MILIEEFENCVSKSYDIDDKKQKMLKRTRVLADDYAYTQMVHLVNVQQQTIWQLN